MLSIAKITTMMCLFLIAGCSENTQDKTEPKISAKTMEIISVSDYNFTMNDINAVSISFGESESNHCEVTIYRTSVKELFIVKSAKTNNKDVALECNWDGKYYVQSSKHSTFVSFSIPTLNKQSKKATFKLSGKLVDPSKEVYFEIDDQKITVDGVFFDNLTKKL